ncbi:MAG: aconitase family protein, partial [Rhodospirillales bacterium]
MTSKHFSAGKTAAEKILARAAGGNDVRPGEIIYPEPDLMIMHDGHAHMFLRELWEMGVKNLWKPERVMVAMDHRVPALNPKIAQSHKETRRWVETYGIEHFFDIGNSGITHQLQIERGFARPGVFIVSRDGHSPTAGAVGCLAISIGQDILPYLALGSSWLRVPETLRLTVTGTAGPGVLARDVAQACAAHIGVERADNRVIEFAGPYVDALDIDGRQVLCNITVEIDAVSAFVNPDAKSIKHVRALTGLPFTPVSSDADAGYAETLDFDVSDLEPIVAAPPSPDNVVPVSSVAGKPVHQIFIGTCAGGTLDDLRAAAGVLEGR